jgi:hypothetical protein
VYAEGAVSQLSSASVSPSGGGASVDVGGASAVSFNVGVEFGNLKQRFAMGYAHDSLSYTGADGTLSGSSMRYDHNIVSIAERMKLRVGFGADFGNGSITATGMPAKDGGGGGFFGGIDATYFLTWSNAVHVFVGGRYYTQQAPGGSLSATGVTAKITLSHTFGDVRPDASFVVPLEHNSVITGGLAVGAQSIGCSLENTGRLDFAAWVEVRCPGDHRISYHQFAEGMLVSCEHETSESRCRDLSDQIAKATLAAMSKPAEPTPAATPAVAPAPPAPQPPAEAPAAGTEPPAASN